MVEDSLCAHSPSSLTQLEPVKEWFSPGLCCTNRKLYRLSSDHWWRMGMHSCCIHNEVRSAWTRVLKHQHKPMTTELHQLMDSVGEEVAREIGTCKVISWDGLLSYLPKSKHKLYSKMIAEVGETGLLNWHSRIKAFVKLEKLYMDHGKDPDPRMIQARTPQFNVQLARYTRSVEKALYNLEEMGVRLLAKGRNSRQRAWDLNTIWSQMEDPVVLSMDLSRWDMHCSPDLLKKAHDVYGRCLGNPPILKVLLGRTINNKCETKNGLKYRREGNVMSGDMTTALGNCLLVIMMVLAFRKHHLVPPAMMRLYDDGDDHLLVLERSIAPQIGVLIQQFYASLGHSLRVEGQSDELESVVFCQQKIITHSQGVLEFTPNPRKALSTSLSFSSGNADKCLEYLGTVWEMRAILHQGQPVLGPLFLRLSKENPKRLSSAGTKLNSLCHRLRLDGRSKILLTEVTQEARESYTKAWGMSEQEQLEIENMEIPYNQLAKLQADDVFEDVQYDTMREG